jgi:ferredoxin-NADP reductase
MKTFRLWLQKPLNLIDGFLDRLTSYQLVLYLLYTYLLWAIVLSFSHHVAFKAVEIASSAGLLLAVCYLFNFGLSKLLDIPRNKESGQITALILALIMSPAASSHGFWVLAFAGGVAIASKYILVISKSHIFNPAAFGAFASGWLLRDYASWWVGTDWMSPLVIVGGFLIIRKMKRLSLVAVFILAYFIILSVTSSNGLSLSLLHIILLSSSLIFFSTIMLTEPSTSPRSEPFLLAYGILAAVLYEVSRLSLSPEEALLLANAFTFIVEPNKRFVMNFVERRQEADSIFSYVFSSKKPPHFTAGQYMEWTLPGAKSDSRGNRRYLTVASSPTEQQVIFTIKEPEKPSSYKQRLQHFKQGDQILASHLEGSFTLPKDPAKKLVFVAGGVGITPFRSIIKYLIDKQEQRQVVLLYLANTPGEFAFKNLFKQAEAAGLKVIYSTNKMSPELIKDNVPDLMERIFYVSGPYGLVKTVKTHLLGLGVPGTNIITDYFPGYG